jgi:uncharacterized membrane protein YphA (DoxX/SURF4 family)
VSSEPVVDRKLVRLSIALVWLYQGLWCKLLAGAPHHLTIVSSVPFIGPIAGHVVLISLGLIECGLGLWVLTGLQQRTAAITQTVLLAVMNSGGLIWAWRLIPDTVAMILQNFAFVLLIWTATEVHSYVANP